MYQVKPSPLATQLALPTVQPDPLVPHHLSGQHGGPVRVSLRSSANENYLTANLKSLTPTLTMMLQSLRLTSDADDDDDDAPELEADVDADDDAPELESDTDSDDDAPEPLDASEYTFTVGEQPDKDVGDTLVGEYRFKVYVIHSE